LAATSSLLKNGSAGSTWSSTRYAPTVFVRITSAALADTATAIAGANTAVKSHFPYVRDVIYLFASFYGAPSMHRHFHPRHLLRPRRCARAAAIAPHIVYDIQILVPVGKLTPLVITFLIR
jgi:hypothetical protein